MIHARSLAILLGVLWLSGCASGGPAPSRYTLPAAPQTGEERTVSNQQRLVIQPVQLARYLDVSGIVFQLDDISLHEAQQHQWAAPLGQQLELGLRDRLARRLGGTQVLLDRDAQRGDDAWRLRLEITRFQGRHDGMAISAGQWQLRDAAGELRTVKPFRIAIPLASDGYPALVQALGSGLDRLADDLAADIHLLR